MNNVNKISERALSHDQIKSIVSLTYATWPSKTLSFDEKLEETIANIEKARDVDDNATRFVVWESDRAIAHALTFERTINVLNSETDNVERPLRILCLAGVCASEEHRGKGLGAAIVRSAFDMVNDVANVCLFQTGVPVFYEKLGCRLVDNEIVNKKDPEDPTKPAFWDDNVMIYPKEFEWPSNKIDLNGRGY